MGNSCQPFSFDPYEGYRAFCAAEMFVAIYNMMIGIQIGRLCVPDLLKMTLRTGTQTLLLVIYCILTLTFILQGVIGLLLFHIGWKRRIITICWIWIGLAVANALLPALALASASWAFSPIPTWVFLYLIYLPYGVTVNFSFIRWCKQTGLAVHFALAPVAIPSASETTVHPDPIHHHEHEGHRQSNAPRESRHTPQSISPNAVVAKDSAHKMRPSHPPRPPTPPKHQSGSKDEGPALLHNLVTNRMSLSAPHAKEKEKEKEKEKDNKDKDKDKGKDVLSDKVKAVKSKDVLSQKDKK